MQSKAQDNVYSSKIDTLQIFEDKLFVKTYTYKDSILWKTSESFFYPREVKISTYLFKTWPLWKRTYLVDSVVNNGESRTYLVSGHSTLKLFDNGKLKSIEYLNPEGIEMSEADYPEPKVFSFVCAVPTGVSYYFYDDRKPLPIFRRRK